MSDAILKAVQEHATATAEELKAIRDSHRELQDEMADLAQKSQTPAGFGQTKKKSVSAMVANDDQLNALRSRQTKSVIISTTASIKAVVGDAGGVGDDAYSVDGYRFNGIANDPRRALSLLEILPSIQVNSNSFEYTALNGFTDAAGYQLAEGDAKQEQAMPTELKTAPIATIAAVLHASEQVLSDSPALAQFIQSRLIYGVRQKLEAEILNGAGGTGQISGLLTEATEFTPTAGISSADAIGEAMAELQSTGWNPGVIVLNPADWQTIRSERTNDGVYVATGWDSPAGPNIWNVPVVASAAMTAGTALVMDPAQAIMLDRMGANFQLGYVGDGFAQNIITSRAELRAGLAVMAASAVLKLTIPPAAA